MFDYDAFFREKINEKKRDHSYRVFKKVSTALPKLRAQDSCVYCQIRSACCQSQGSKLPMKQPNNFTSA